MTGGTQTPRRARRAPPPAALLLLLPLLLPARGAGGQAAEPAEPPQQLPHLRQQAQYAAFPDGYASSLEPPAFAATVRGAAVGTLIEFYAPWCGHCKRLALDYEKVGQAFARVPGVEITKLDCNAHNQYCKGQRVDGYPTIRWYPANISSPMDFTEYTGAKDAASLVAFVNREAGLGARLKQAPSKVAALDGPGLARRLAAGRGHTLVQFFAPWCGHCRKFAPEYERVGAAFAREAAVDVVKVNADGDPALKREYNVTGYPTVVLVHGGARVRYEGERSAEALLAFVNDRAGASRTLEGGEDEADGRVGWLDRRVLDYLALPAEGGARAAAAALEAEAATVAFYARLVSGHASEGPAFLLREREGLEAELAGLAGEEARAVRRRLNVLRLFRLK